MKGAVAALHHQEVSQTNIQFISPLSLVDIELSLLKRQDNEHDIDAMSELENRLPCWLSHKTTSILSVTDSISNFLETHHVGMQNKWENIYLVVQQI